MPAIKSYMKKAAALRRDLISRGEKVKWPMSKAVYNSYFPGPSEPVKKIKKTVKKVTKKFNWKKFHEEKHKLFNDAKSKGYNKPYNKSSIKELNEYIKNYISDDDFLLMFRDWLGIKSMDDMKLFYLDRYNKYFKLTEEDNLSSSTVYDRLYKKFVIPNYKKHLLTKMLLLSSLIIPDNNYLLSNVDENGDITKTLTISNNLKRQLTVENYNDINELITKDTNYFSDIRDSQKAYRLWEYSIDSKELIIERFTRREYYELKNPLGMSPNENIFITELLNDKRDILQEELNKVAHEKYKTRKQTKDGYFPFIIDETKYKENIPDDIKSLIKHTYKRYVHPNQDNECFGHALKLKFPDLYNKFKTLRLFSNGTSLAAKHYPLIAEKLNICIKKRYKIGTTEAKKQYKYKTYGKKTDPVINIISYNDHCFLDEITPIHLRDIKNCFITEIKQINEKSKNMTSYKFISTLKKLGLLTSIHTRKFLKFNTTKVPKSDYLEEEDEEPNNKEEFIIHGNDPDLLDGCDATNTKDVEITKFEKGMYDNDNDIVYFDSETFNDQDYTQEKTKKVKYHNPYLCVAETQDNNNTYTFLGDDCGEQFLLWLKKYYSKWDNEQNKYKSTITPTIIMHNAGYDFSFLIGINGLIIRSRIGSSIRNTKRAECIYKGFRFIVQDSYSFIQMKLEKFSKDLQLDEEYKKGIFPYDIVTKSRLDKNSCSIEKALLTIKEQDKEEFIKQISPHLIYTDSDKIRHTNPKKFRITDLAIEYCKQDIKVLKKGFTKFREQIHEIASLINHRVGSNDNTGLDMLNCISLPGVSLDLVLSKGLLDNVHPLTGVCRQFVQQTICGGRCQTFHNTIWDVNEECDDWDIKSLYPSVYSKLEIPQGLPEQIKPDDIHRTDTIYLDKLYRMYFLEVNILTVRKPRGIASLSQKNKNGVREWIDKPGIYFLNSINLQDLCEFQEITYIVLGGLGYSLNLPYIKWDQFNDTIYKYKEEYSEKGNDSMASIIKLLSNSIYGKMAQNAITDKEKIFTDIYNNDTYVRNGVTQLSPKERFNDYIDKNFNDIQLITYFKGPTNIDCAHVKTKCAVYNHMSYNHIASYILSLSKRVMNRAIYICLDNNIEVGYTDTDSIFIKTKDRNTFIDKYTEKYGESPIQKKIGFFDSDLKKALPKAKDGCDHINIKLVKCLKVGKKLYSDVIQYDTINKETKEQISKDNLFYNTKCKGIPHDVIDYTTKKLGYVNSYELMLDISRGKSITFDMTMDNKKACFVCEKDFKFKTLNDFTRTIRLE